MNDVLEQREQGVSTAGSDWLLDAHDLHKTYAIEQKSLEVLKGVSLQVKKGETVSVMGASGSGKSTLLHILGGLDHPDRGRVVFEQRNLYRLSRGKRTVVRSQKIGFVFQSYHLLPELNVVENVTLPALGVSGALRRVGETKAKAMHLLEQVGLVDRASHRPAELSGGEQQRVALARALMNDPVMVYADEPTGNLDSNMGEQVLNYLFKLVEEGGGLRW